MNILVVAGDYWHHAAVAQDGLRPLEDKGYSFTFLTDGREFSADALHKYALVLFVKSDNRTDTDTEKWMTPQIRQDLREYVQNGGAMLVVHSGLAGYSDMEDMRELFGGLFAWHPKQLPVTFELKANHPLTQGCSSFTEMDEHYFINMDEGPVDVFMTSSSRHGTVPAGWTRTEGSGRVCVLTPGHNVEVWLHPSFQRLLENTLDWCAGK